jgi:hypothetical protein
MEQSGICHLWNVFHKLTMKLMERARHFFNEIIHFEKWEMGHKEMKRSGNQKIPA